MPRGTVGGMRLRIMRDGRAVRSYKVKPETFTIGSGKEATIRASATAGLASTHALVWLQEGVPVLVPSPGCTVEVNGEPVQVAQLAPDDVVSLGRLQLQIEGLEPEGSPGESPSHSSPLAHVEEDEDTAETQVSPRPPPVAPRPILAAPQPEQDELEETTEVAAPPRMHLPSSVQPPRVPTVINAWPPSPFAEPAAAPEAQEAPKAPEQLAAPSVPSPLSLGWADDYDLEEDDEDDELDFVEPFSLTEHLERVVPENEEGARERYVVAQVVRHREGRLWDVSSVRPGKDYAPTAGEPRLLSLDREGSCQLFVTPGMTGTVWLAGREALLSEMLDDPDRGGPLRLAEGDRALVVTADARFIVQLLRPPRPGPPRLVQALTSASVLALYAVAVMGLVGGAAFVLEPLYGPRPTPAVAAVDMEDPVWRRGPILIAPPPPEEPVEEPVVEETASPAQETSEGAASPSPPPSTSRPPVKGGGGGGGRPSAVTSLIQALGPSGGGGALGDAITNIDALTSDDPGDSQFQVGGVIGKALDGEVNIGGGGPRGPIQTVGIREPQQGTPGIGVVEGTKRPRPTRGTVRRVPGGGRVPPTIDRAGVEREIGRHMGRIRWCYESRLLDNPSLSGRLRFAWTVNAAGRVAGVSVQSGDLPDSSVASCIRGVIRGMRFPRPTGGAIRITYPFVFRATDR